MSENQRFFGGARLSLWLLNHSSSADRSSGLDIADFLSGLGSVERLEVGEYLE